MTPAEPGDGDKVNKGIDYTKQKTLPVRSISRQGDSPEMGSSTPRIGSLMESSTPRSSVSSNGDVVGLKQNMIKPMGRRQTHSLHHARTLMTTSIVVTGVEPMLEVQAATRSVSNNSYSSGRSSPTSTRSSSFMFSHSPSFVPLDQLSNFDDDLDLSAGYLLNPHPASASSRHSFSTVSPMIIPHNKTVKFAFLDPENNTVVSAVKLYHEDDQPEMILQTVTKQEVFLCERPCVVSKKRKRKPLLDSDGRPIPKQKNKTVPKPTDVLSEEEEENDEVLRIAQSHRVETHYPHCAVFVCCTRGLDAECITRQEELKALEECTSVNTSLDSDILVLNDLSRQSSMESSSSLTSVDSTDSLTSSIDSTDSMEIVHEHSDILSELRPRRNSMSNSAQNEYDVREGHAFRDARRKERNPKCEMLFSSLVRKVKGMFEKKENMSEMDKLFNAVDLLKKKGKVVSEDTSEETMNEIVKELEKLTKSSGRQHVHQQDPETLTEEAIQQVLEPLLIPVIAVEEPNSTETKRMEQQPIIDTPESEKDPVNDKMFSVLHKLIISEDELDRKVAEHYYQEDKNDEDDNDDSFTVETFTQDSCSSRGILKKTVSIDTTNVTGMNPQQAVRARVLMDTVGRILALRVLRNGIKVAILNDLGIEEERYIWVEDGCQICWSTEPLDKHKGLKKLFLKTERRDVMRVKKIALGTFLKRRGAYSMKPSKYVSWNCITLEFATNIPRIDKSGKPKDGVELETALRNIEIVCTDDDTTRKVFMGLQTVIPLDKTALSYGAFLWKRAALKARRIAFDKVMDKKSFIEELWGQARELRYVKFHSRWKLRERVDAYSFVCAQMSALCATTLWRDGVHDLARKEPSERGCPMQDFVKEQEKQDQVITVLSKVIPPRTVNMVEVLKSRRFLKQYIIQKLDAAKELGLNELIDLANGSIRELNTETVETLRGRIQTYRQLELEQVAKAENQLKRGEDMNDHEDQIHDISHTLSNPTLVDDLPDTVCSVMTQKLNEASKLNKELAKITVKYSCKCECSCNNQHAHPKPVSQYTCPLTQMREAEANNLTEIAGGLHKELWHAGGTFVSKQTSGNTAGRNVNNKSLGGPIPLEAARKMMQNAERTEDHFAKIVSFVAFIKALTYPYLSGFEKELLNETVEVVSLKKEIDELLKHL